MAAAIGAPCMLSLASTSTATPNFAVLPALSGTTCTPVTGAPFSVTFTLPASIAAFDGSERTKDLVGNVLAAGGMLMPFEPAPAPTAAASASDAATANRGAKRFIGPGRLRARPSRARSGFRTGQAG